MNAPQWIQETIAEFGRAAGIENFVFNDRDVAALSFDRGAILAFEYAYSSLNIIITLPLVCDAENAKRLLSFAAPERRGEFRMKTGFMPKGDKAFFAVRLPHEEVSLPVINAAISYLRSIADQFGEGVG
jgi:type III secretion system chaperone SycN